MQPIFFRFSNTSHDIVEYALMTADQALQGFDLSVRDVVLPVDYDLLPG